MYRGGLQKVAMGAGEGVGAWAAVVEGQRWLGCVLRGLADGLVAGSGERGVEDGSGALGSVGQLWYHQLRWGQSRRQ